MQPSRTKPINDIMERKYKPIIQRSHEKVNFSQGIYDGFVM
jgi:hypothetical protein